MAFIVFEGLDGAGKTTLIEALKKKLSAQNKAFVLSREPGGTPLGDEIRQMLLRKNGAVPVPRAELFLYEAGRAQHVDEVIQPALQAGKWVICDRYYASSVAFQCGGRNLNRQMVDELNAWAVDGAEPDLWVLLDLTTEEAARRMQGRELDRFESENKDFHERVRQSYLHLAKMNPDNWLVLDASKSANALAEMLFERLQKMGLIA